MNQRTFNFTIGKHGELNIQSDELTNLLISNSGKKGVINITIIDDRETKSIIAYYTHSIIPRIQEYYIQQEGVKYLPDHINDILFNNASCVSHLDHTNIYKLDYTTICFFIAEIRRFAAETLSIYIP